MIELARLWMKLPGMVRDVVVAVVRAIANEPSDAGKLAAARRALEVTAKVRAFDEAMKRR